ncbi:MAG: homoserine kinase [Polyangiaceae bacterium]
MAVLTAITADDARALLDQYGVVDFQTVEGIPAGSVNSNFALQAGGRPLFLRIYEEQDRAGAEGEAAMLERLARAGVPTPAPLRRVDGALVSTLGGKPAALFPWRDGTIRCQAGVTPDDARRVGEALALVHVAGAAERRDQGRFRLADLALRLNRIEASGEGLFAPITPSLREALRGMDAARDPGLPRGLIHGDLFRDNVLWKADGQVAALLDFESACDGTYAYDLMVTVLAWCVGDDFDGGLARAMTSGYEGVRPLTEQERRGLWAEAAFGALRFTVTRITDYALRAEVRGPRVVKDWRRFMMRFEKLRALGADGFRERIGT